MGVRSSLLRALGAVVVLAGSAGAVLAATEYPAPATGTADAVRRIEVPAGPTSVVCPSEPSLPDTGVAEDQDFRPEQAKASAQFVVASFPRDGGAGPGTVEDAAGGAPRALSGSAALLATADSFPVASWARVEPVGGDTALAAGAVVWRVDAGDLRSLAGSPCIAPASESWIVGGSTAVGRSARLELTNPGSTTATVTVSAWGPTGVVDLPLLVAVPIAPASSQTILLEANAAGVDRLALQVVARGGQVAATLLDTALSGLTPGGVDFGVPTAVPARELVLPGLSLAGDASAGEDFVRIVNPGDAPAAVTLALLTAEGTEPVAGAESVTVDAHAVFDVSLAGLPAGDHALRLTADQPVAAAAQVTRRGGADDGPVDRAWVVATEATGGGAVVIPAGTAARLVIASAGTVDAVVRLTPWDADGVAGVVRELAVPAGSVVAVDDVGTVVLSADGAVHAAAVLEVDTPDGALVSVLPLTPDANGRQTIGVLVREE